MWSNTSDFPNSQQRFLGATEPLRVLYLILSIDSTALTLSFSRTVDVGNVVLTACRLVICDHCVFRYTVCRYIIVMQGSDRSGERLLVRYTYVWWIHSGGTRMSQTLYIPHPHITRLHDVYGTVYIMCIWTLPVHTVRI